MATKSDEEAAEAARKKLPGGSAESPAVATTKDSVASEATPAGKKAATAAKKAVPKKAAAPVEGKVADKKITSGAGKAKASPATPIWRIKIIADPMAMISENMPMISGVFVSERE